MKTYEERKEEFIKEYPFGAELLEYYGNDLDEAMEAVEDRYIGEYESLEDYAREITDTTGVPEYILHYIDYESMGRDWELAGDIFTIETGYKKLHIFSSR